MPNLKEKISKAKYYRTKEKEMKKKQKEFDKEIDKEYKEKYPKDHDDISNKLAKKMVEFFDMLWPDDEEEIEKEYNEYLTENERKELEEYKKEDKRIMRTGFSIMFSLVVVVILIIFGYAYANRSEYEKVTKPLITSYFKNHYNKDIEITDHELICYEDKNEEDQTVEKCTDLLVSTTNFGTHALTINNEYKGDDVSQNAFKESYKADLEKTFPDMQIVSQDATLSYSEFYHDYGLHTINSKILPINKNYSELVETGKLTVSNIVIYQGLLNVNEVQTYLKSFSDNSKMYLIKLNAGLPANLTIISKNSVIDANITSNYALKQNITYYELNKEVNATNSIELKEIASQGISERRSSDDSPNYEYANSIYFDVDTERTRSDEPEKPHYYLIKFTNNSYVYNDLNILKGDGGSYRILDKDEYPLYVTLTIGSDTYLISDQALGLTTKTEKKDGFLCNLGLC